MEQCLPLLYLYYEKHYEKQQDVIFVFLKICIFIRPLVIIRVTILFLFYYRIPYFDFS